MDESSETILLLSFLLTILYYYETRFNLKPIAANPNQGRETVAEWLVRPELLCIHFKISVHGLGQGRS